MFLHYQISLAKSIAPEVTQHSLHTQMAKVIMADL